MDENTKSLKPPPRSWSRWWLASWVGSRSNKFVTFLRPIRIIAARLHIPLLLFSKTRKGFEPQERTCRFGQNQNYLGVSKNRGTPKWMVKIMENPIKMDDLGIPLFSETSIWKFQPAIFVKLDHTLWVTNTQWLKPPPCKTWTNTYLVPKLKLCSFFGRIDSLHLLVPKIRRKFHTGAKLHKKELVRNIRAYKSLKPHIRLNHDTSPTRILCNPVDSLEMSHLRPLQFDLTGLTRASFPGNNMNAWMQLPSSKLT